MNNRKEGLEGESMAERYLRGLGYEILARNYVCKTGEIDLVARDGSYVVFVEVKRREYTRFGMPYEAVTPEKQRRLVRTAQAYLLAHKMWGADVRFDVVSILRDEITHFENAFEAR